MLTFTLVFLGFVLGLLTGNLLLQLGLLTGNLLLQLAYRAGIVEYKGIPKPDAARATGAKP